MTSYYRTAAIKTKARNRTAKVNELEEKLHNCTKTCDNDPSRRNVEDLECLQAEEDQLYRVSQKFVPLISCAITFWSKLHFYMKFLNMFLTLSSTCVQKFSYRHPPFVFLSHLVAVAALSEISHVACRALDDSFWAFLSPSMQESLRPPNNIIF